MSLFTNGHGEDSRKALMAIYRIVTMLAIGIIGYFLKGLHEDLQSTASITWDMRAKIEVLQQKLDFQQRDTERRLESLERQQFRSIRPQGGPQ